MPDDIPPVDPQQLPLSVLEHDVGGPDEVFSPVDHGEVERPDEQPDELDAADAPPSRNVRLSLMCSWR